MQIEKYTNYSSLNTQQQQVVDLVSEAANVAFDVHNEEADFEYSIIFTHHIKEYLDGTSNLMTAEDRSQFTAVLEELEKAEIKFINLK